MTVPAAQTTARLLRIAAISLGLMVIHPIDMAGAAMNGRILFDSQTRNGVGIFSIDPTGTAAAKLIRLGNSPSWSPDATRFAYSGSGKGKKASTSKEIFVAQADGGSARQLTTDPARDDFPAWSPYGGLIAFQRGTQIWLMNADGTDQRALVTTESNADPSWSPWGDRIAFTCTRGFATTDICVVEVATGAVTNLTPGGRNDSHPDWSPDRQTIIFSSAPAGSGGDDGLYTIEPNALIPSPKLFFDQPGTDETDPSWSPNGLWVAFAGQAEALGLSDIYVMSTEGFGITPFRTTADLAWDDHPDWGVAA